MGTICQQCGGKGFANAFVYCVTCLNFPVHRYCLPKLPETFDEFVRWYCEDCELKMSIKHSSSKKPSKKTDRLISKGVCLKKCSKLKEKNISYLVDQGQQRSPSQQPCDSNKKPDCTMHLRQSFPYQKDSDAQFQLTDHDKMASDCSDLNPKSKGKENSVAPPLVTETEQQICQISQKELALCVDQNLTMQHLVAGTEDLPCSTENYENDLELVNGRQLTVEGGGEFGEEAELDRIDDFQTAAGNLSNTLEQNYHLHAKPATDRIWRGSFSICTKIFAIFDGIVAHLSSKACQKACEEAALLPAVLRLEMLSKSTIWPDSFKKLEPCYEPIHLYFFPESQWYEWVFDRLVDDMIDQELAMRAVVKNAELLVFPSAELPIQYSKHQGKYYLCGVFRENQDSSLHLANGMGSEEERNLRRSKSCDPGSPQSPLSNNCSLE